MKTAKKTAVAGRSKPAASHRHRGRSLRILLVDDEPDTLRLYELWLDQRGYEVRTAYNGETALAIAPRFSPDIVIADLWMPGMDGMELCRRLKASRATRGAFLVLSSGRPPLQVEEECRRIGVGRFLDKPTPRATFHAMMDTIDRAFGARAA